MTFFCGRRSATYTPRGADKSEEDIPDKYRLYTEYLKNLRRKSTVELQAYMLKCELLALNGDLSSLNVTCNFEFSMSLAIFHV